MAPAKAVECPKRAGPSRARDAELATATLERPLDSMFVRDAAVLHGVTPVTQAERGRMGRRDMLVIDYNVVRS